MRTLIKNGTIWYQGKWFNGDIDIENGVIKGISSEIKNFSNNYKIYDARGKIVIPGLIDLHVHLREPGFEEKETIRTGSKAAVAGGFTTIAVMPNTNPVIDKPNLVTFIKGKAKEANYAKILPIGAITYGERGEELTDFAEMKKTGAIGFSDDGKGVQLAITMKKAMEKAMLLGVSIIAHCEDESLVQDGVIHSGELAEKLGVSTISSESEYLQLARDLILAGITGVHYHVCHISTKESVQLIREAKLKGINVTAEVTPHHLILFQRDICHPYSLYKVNPPLRTEEDRIALIDGLIDGTIDIIATDHAPHTDSEKSKNIMDAPFGMIGLEIAFPALYTRLVKTNILSIELLINKLTYMPSKIYNLNSGIIEIGSKADITIIDLNLTKIVDSKTFYSKGSNTPFLGMELSGWPVLTIVDGEIKWRYEEGLRDG
ncbi:MAG: dihydroorotase [Vulcanibacillus sp.]